jgi:elongator complex protein 3
MKASFQSSCTSDRPYGINLIDHLGLLMDGSHADYSLHREIIDALLVSTVPLSRREVNKIKNQVCAKYHIARIPTNADILQSAVPQEVDFLKPFLQKRPVRTASGVAVVAAMTEPHACPHGKCAYCPGGPDLGVPQSYTGHEPATMRGIQHGFDPFRQVRSRLDQLKTIGHDISKVELIVMGGDWCSKDLDYRKWFVKGCLDAMNGCVGQDLRASMRTNETAEVRNVGLTFETRPDLVTDESIDAMLDMGATRVELGVQTLSDSILEHVQRGHGVQATIDATQKLRDSGLKICYHMMPGLPGSSPANDIADFEQLFANPSLQPDMLKIYPTIVVKGTKLYEWWVKGEYKPYTTAETVELVSTAVSKMPEYVRIQRMQRDIPLHQIEAGLDQGNLRELVHRNMAERSLRNPTIRYREVGQFMMRTGERVDTGSISLVTEEYDAAGGKEFFLSFQDRTKDVLFGFLRLRFPSEVSHRSEIKGNSTSIIRELRVYGPVVPLGEHDPQAWQHLGLGEKLIGAAIKISKGSGFSRLLVNSGIGVKEYYRNLGFIDEGPYLVKAL